MTAIDSSFKSQVNPKIEYSNSLWVVTLQNVGGICGGHARIIVEGRENDRSFVGQYEIAHYKKVEKDASDAAQAALGNVQGYITGINAERKFEHRHDYSKYHSRIWYAKPQDVQKMVDSIEKMKKAVDAETAQFLRNNDISALTHKYQVAGSARTKLLGGNGGDSCVTWAEKMLALSKAGNGVKMVDSIKAAPEAHVLPWEKILAMIVAAGALYAYAK